MDVSISLVIFLALAAMAIISSLMVVVGRNLFNAAMFLGAYLLVIAGFYFLLSAELVGIMQVFVYVGGVVVVLLFGIMLTSQMINVRLVSALQQRVLTLVVVAALVGLLVSIFSKTSFYYISSAEAPRDSISLIGKLFMTDYVLPFEVISVLLLAALIGAVIIAREEGRQ
ncbi:MAG: NADH-quinone oxidoreductase subunit J [Actinobacteria bacterium]|nr:NADH-quinone oxidoreductase subunit J [Actinomycetota bacterium]